MAQPDSPLRRLAGRLRCDPRGYAGRDRPPGERRGGRGHHPRPRDGSADRPARPRYARSRHPDRRRDLHPGCDYAGGDAFTYKVTDFKGLVSNEAAVILTVNAVNDAPAANAGPDQTVAGGSIVTLTGAASSDVEGAIAAYLWTQTGGTAVSLANPNAVQTAFTAPAVGLEGSDPDLPADRHRCRRGQNSDTVVVQVVTQGSDPPRGQHRTSRRPRKIRRWSSTFSKKTATPPATSIRRRSRWWPGRATARGFQRPDRRRDLHAGHELLRQRLFTYQVRDNAGTFFPMRPR